MAKIGAEKLKNGVSYFKAHWKIPPEGKYVSFREYIYITISRPCPQSKRAYSPTAH